MCALSDELKITKQKTLKLKNMKFTSGTIENLDDHFNTVVLYYGNKIVYKCTLTKLQAADLYCKYNNLKFI